MRHWILVAISVLGLGLAACGSGTGDLERRVTALEAQPQIGDLIVVSKEIRTVGAGGDFCVSYRAFDEMAEMCLHAATGDNAASILANALIVSCWFAAKVGEPLPHACR